MYKKQGEGKMATLGYEEARNMLRESINNIGKTIRESGVDAELKAMLMSHLHDMIIEYRLFTFDSVPKETLDKLDKVTVALYKRFLGADRD